MEQRSGDVLDVRREFIELRPNLNGDQEQFYQFCLRVVAAVGEDESSLNAALERLKREVVDSTGPQSTERVTFSFVKSVLLDLICQGWQLEVDTPRVRLFSPLPENGSPLHEKDRVRKGHLIERDSQLRIRSVTDFIRGMERRRLTAKGWHSIFSLMRDGRELSEKLHKAAAAEKNEDREILLQQAIAPYIQFVESSVRCPETGLALMDVWRYFRHTWVNVYKSLPGRSLQVLIRDAASPNHPVIGIAALGSSVVQQKIRDVWIGWDSATFIDTISQKPTTKMARWLVRSLDRLTRALYTKDLFRDGICRPQDIRYPTERVIKKLRTESDKAIKQHQRFPHATLHKSHQGVKTKSADWERAALTSLFRSKRCKTLASLLSIRKVFGESGLQRGTLKEVKKAAQFSKFRSAIGQLIRQIKAEHVGVDMMDIVVCGAIAPYNLLLGGKLVCMMLCSPETVQHYKKRYGTRVSVIASSMRGRPVRRSPCLVLMGTTSLYGVGSSQYNRVKIPTEAIGSNFPETVEYKKLGLSEGFGSFHFSRETLNLMNVLLARRRNGRRVNSIFGEGVNPLMRKIREALDLVGLSSDFVLRHGNRRVVYGIHLARNFRDILLGLAKRPSYLIPQRGAKYRTDMIVNYWRRRWLAARINKPGIIEEVDKHRLSYPIHHGARVPCPDLAEDSAFLPGL